MAYAERTSVPVAQSRAEIEKLLKAVKAQRVVTMDEAAEAIVMFMLAGRLIKITAALKPGDDQARRSRWRNLLLTVKAKREAVESGIETVEQAWLSHIVLPDGRTMSEWAEPALRLAYEKGEMPVDPLRLPAPRGLVSHEALHGEKQQRLRLADESQAASTVTESMGGGRGA